MKYLIENCNNCDRHLFYFTNYLIEVEFYQLRYWILAVKYCTTLFGIYLYLPTCNVFINKNKLNG